VLNVHRLVRAALGFRILRPPREVGIRRHIVVDRREWWRGDVRLQ
jgi:hypothetical protein